jgi:hypothetical protein
VTNRGLIFFGFATRDNFQCLIRQRPLQPFGFIPGRTQPDVVFFRRLESAAMAAWFVVIEYKLHISPNL